MKPTPEQLKGNGESIPTMTVVLRDSEHREPVIINAHEFDSKLHQEVGASEEEEEKGGEPADFDSMTKKELEEHLAANDVAFAKNSNKEALVALAKEHAGQ